MFKGLLHDEQGSKSAMRCSLFFFVFPMLVAMTVVEVWHPFQPTVWTVWSSIAGMLIVGCFGPRVAQYLAPPLGAMMSAIGQAKRDPRLPSRLDDERHGGES